MLEPAEEALHRAVPKPNWYLDAIAVEPGQQGRGIGSALLDAARAHTDAAGLPISLLTFQPRNLALYQCQGYAIVCEGTAPDGGPRGGACVVIRSGKPRALLSSALDNHRMVCRHTPDETTRCLCAMMPGTRGNTLDHEDSVVRRLS